MSQHCSVSYTIELINAFGVIQSSDSVWLKWKLYSQVNVNDMTPFYSNISYLNF